MKDAQELQEKGQTGTETSSLKSNLPMAANTSHRSQPLSSNPSPASSLRPCLGKDITPSWFLLDKFDSVHLTDLLSTVKM